MEIKENKWCVYTHTNKINGKKYVGQTCQIPEKRWKNGNGYKRNPYFYNAIQKYGWDNFEHQILASDLTLEEASQYSFVSSGLSINAYIKFHLDSLITALSSGILSSII